MLALPLSLTEQIEVFQNLPDARRRMLHLISQGRELKSFPEEKKLAANLVQGCVATVYLCVEIQDGKMFFTGEADALTIKGLVAILIKGLNGLCAEQILKISPDFIGEFGIQQSMMPGRTNGFYNIFAHIRTLAENL